MKKPPAKKIKLLEPTEPTRVSRRRLGQAPDGKEKDSANEEAKVKAEIDRARVAGTIELSPTAEGKAFLQSLQELNDDVISFSAKQDNRKKKDNPFSSYKSRLAFNGSVKVTPDMIYSICVHPNPEKLLSFVGDKKGVLAIWDITDSLEKSSQSQEEEVIPIVHSFKPFKRAISKIMLPSKQNKVFLSSHDGSIREFDIISQKFNEVFVHPKEESLGGIDFVHPENIWFCTHSGEVGLIDSRTPSSKKAKFIFKASAKKINTIDFNRNASKHHFVTAGLDHIVRVFDTRKLKEVDGLLEPVASYSHQKSVNGAFYDPSGSSIASLSFDDIIMLWNNAASTATFSSGDGAKTPHIAIRHNNNTGRWVQKFKPVWRPFVGANGESVFAVGNMGRKVEIFSGKTGEALAVLEDPQRLTAIPAVNAFHPNPACGVLISGNASGRMNVWM